MLAIWGRWVASMAGWHLVPQSPGSRSTRDLGWGGLLSGPAGNPGLTAAVEPPAGAGIDIQEPDHYGSFCRRVWPGWMTRKDVAIRSAYDATAARVDFAIVKRMEAGKRIRITPGECC